MYRKEYESWDLGLSGASGAGVGEGRQRRGKDRRCLDLEPRFPCVDFDGQLIQEDRRRIPDRRLHIDVQWIAIDCLP
jgi:hypothetical protein